MSTTETEKVVATVPRSEAGDSPSVKGVSLIDVHWAKVVFVLTPTILCMAAFFEAGFFDAVGVVNPFQISLILPIPLQELLRTALFVSLGCLFLTILASVLYWLLSTFWDWIWYVVYAFLPPNWKDIADGAKRLPKARKIRINATSRFLAKHRRWFRDVPRLIIGLVYIGLFFWVVPIIVHINFPSENFGKTMVEGFYFALGIALSLRWLARLTGIETPQRLRIEFPSNGTSVLLGLFFLSIVYAAGFEMGSKAARGESSNRPGISIHGSKCPLGNNVRLLRAYSNGTILLNGQAIVWLPVSGDVCWSLPVRKHQFVEMIHTPTVFGWHVWESYTVRKSKERRSPEL